MKRIFLLAFLLLPSCKQIDSSLSTDGNYVDTLCHRLVEDPIKRENQFGTDKEKTAFNKCLKEYGELTDDYIDYHSHLEAIADEASVRSLFGNPFILKNKNDKCLVGIKTNVGKKTNGTWKFSFATCEKKSSRSENIAFNIYDLIHVKYQIKGKDFGTQLTGESSVAGSGDPQSNFKSVTNVAFRLTLRDTIQESRMSNICNDQDADDISCIEARKTCDGVVETQVETRRGKILHCLGVSSSGSVTAVPCEDAPYFIALPSTKDQFDARSPKNRYHNLIALKSTYMEKIKEKLKTEDLLDKWLSENETSGVEQCKAKEQETPCKDKGFHWDDGLDTCLCYTFTYNESGDIVDVVQDPEHPWNDGSEWAWNPEANDCEKVVQNDEEVNEKPLIVVDLGTINANSCSLYHSIEPDGDNITANNCNVNDDNGSPSNPLYFHGCTDLGYEGEADCNYEAEKDGDGESLILPIKSIRDYFATSSRAVGRPGRLYKITYTQGGDLIENKRDECLQVVGSSIIALKADECTDEKQVKFHLREVKSEREDKPDSNEEASEFVRESSVNVKIAILNDFLKGTSGPDRCLDLDTNTVKKCENVKPTEQSIHTGRLVHNPEGEKKYFQFFPCLITTTRTDEGIAVDCDPDPRPETRKERRKRINNMFWSFLGLASIFLIGTALPTLWIAGLSLLLSIPGMMIGLKDCIDKPNVMDCTFVAVEFITEPLLLGFDYSDFLRIRKGLTDGFSFGRIRGSSGGIRDADAFSLAKMLIRRGAVLGGKRSGLISKSDDLTGTLARTIRKLPEDKDAEKFFRKIIDNAQQMKVRGVRTFWRSDSPIPLTDLGKRYLYKKTLLEGLKDNNLTPKHRKRLQKALKKLKEKESEEIPTEF